MVKLGHISIAIALLLSILLPGCTLQEDPQIPVTDPFDELVEEFQLTEDQAEQLKSGTGTLQLTEQQAELTRDNIEQALEDQELEEWLGETRWQELCDIYDTVLTNHEVDLQRVADLARDIYENLQEQEAVELVTTLEKLSEEEAYVAQEQDTWASTLTTSTLVYTPGGADEGDMDFHYQPAQWGWARAWANYDTGANAESGGVAVYSESLLGLGSAEARARQRILIYVPYDDTDVRIEATVLYQTATSEYLMDAAGTYTTYRDLNDDSWVHESIDPLFGWLDAGKKVLGTIEWIAAVLFLTVDAATLAEVAPIMDDIHDYEALREALLKDPSTGGEREVTHSADSLDAGYYYFEVGLRARTGSVLFGTAAALAIGQVTQIEVTQSFEEPAVEFHLSISSTAGGSVTTPGTGTYTYDAGTVVNLVATPAAGYRFVNWTGDVDTIANTNAASTTITMNGDYSITANFETIPPVQYDLTISSITGGTVTTPGTGTYTYDAGTVVNLVATPAAGYRFVNWTGDVSTIADADDATTTIIMNGHYSITANFEQIPKYNLTISSTAGGSVTTPGEGTFIYNAGTVVNLVATRATGYRFVSWTGDVGTVGNVNAASTTITMNGDYSITANFEKQFAGGSGTVQNPYQITNWHHLHNVRYYLNSHFILINNLDSFTSGYTELASPTANGGKGWQPIGAHNQEFDGSFHGCGYEIRDLFINRPSGSYVGLFGIVGGGGVIGDVGVVNALVDGGHRVGTLVGENSGTLSNSYSTGTVTNNYHYYVGGLAGYNFGTISDSYSTASVTGMWGVGGLIGENPGSVINSYSTGSVTGIYHSAVNNGKLVGGLVGYNTHGTVNNCYSTGHVSGTESVGGLVGYNTETVINSHSTSSVSGIEYVGGLIGENLGDSGVSNSYSTGSVTGNSYVAGLAGFNSGDVNDSYSSSSVIGDAYVGGLVGKNWYGIVSKSYSRGSVTGNSYVGGLVGDWEYGSVSNSFWDIETSGQATSDGGTGKNTTEMQDITTFSVVGWNIIAVALNETNPVYIWNIVNNVTYPFLSWQSVS